MTGAIQPRAIAKALGKADRSALLALDDEAWGKVPTLTQTTNLLFSYSIPLIVVQGDWAKRSRIGSEVCRLLEPAS